MVEIFQLIGLPIDHSLKTSLIKDYIQYGANVDAENEYGETALFKAIENNDIEIVKLLIENGANVCHTSRYGKTPLIRAIGSNKEILLMLINNGADINQCDYAGSTPLMEASANSSLEIVETLIKFGADTANADNYGYTALTGAINTIDSDERIHLLIKNGANLQQALLTEYDERNEFGMMTLLNNTKHLREAFKEELMMSLCHPKRITKWLDAGNDIEDYLQ